MREQTPNTELNEYGRKVYDAEEMDAYLSTLRTEQTRLEGERDHALMEVAKAGYLLRRAGGLLDEAVALKATAERSALNAAVTALESVQAQGLFWHHSDGSLPDQDTVMRIVTTALSAALSSTPTPEPT